jgi:hypothetical protein
MTSHLDERVCFVAGGGQFFLLYAFAAAGAEEILDPVGILCARPSLQSELNGVSAIRVSSALAVSVEC